MAINIAATPVLPPAMGTATPASGPTIVGQAIPAPEFGLEIFNPKTQTAIRIPLTASQQAQLDALLAPWKAKPGFSSMNLDDLIVDNGAGAECLDSAQDRQLIEDLRKLVCDALGKTIVFKRFSPESPMVLGAPRALNRYGSARLQEAQFAQKDLIEALDKPSLTTDLPLTPAEQIELIKRTEAAKASCAFYEHLFKELEKHIHNTMKKTPQYLSLLESARSMGEKIKSVDYNAILFEAASPLNIDPQSRAARQDALERKHERAKQWVNEKAPPKFPKAVSPTLSLLGFTRSVNEQAYNDIRKIEEEYINDLVLNNITSRQFRYEGRQILGYEEMQPSGIMRKIPGYVEKQAFEESFVCGLNALIATGTAQDIIDYLNGHSFSLAFHKLDTGLQDKVRIALKEQALHVQKTIQAVQAPSQNLPPKKLVLHVEKAVASALKPIDICFTDV